MIYSSLLPFIYAGLAFLLLGWSMSATLNLLATIIEWMFGG
jgi:hypothetical protein